MGYEIDFLPADKHKYFLQIDSITLGVHGQPCPKHPKRQLHNIFVISQGKRKKWCWFFPADNCQTFFQSDTVIFLCVWSDMPKLPKTKSLLFLCNILRKKWMKKLTFCMQVSMKTYHKLTLWFWWRLSNISKVPKIASFAMSVQYPKKEVRDEVDFLHVNKHQSGLQVDFNTLGNKFGYKVILWSLISMMKHFRITQSNNFANLCNISKKLEMEFIFCMQIDTGF